MNKEGPQDGGVDWVLERLECHKAKALGYLKKKLHKEALLSLMSMGMYLLCCKKGEIQLAKGDQQKIEGKFLIFLEEIIPHLGSPVFHQIGFWIITECLLKEWGEDISISSVQVFQNICEIIKKMPEDKAATIIKNHLAPHIADWSILNLNFWSRHENAPKEIKNTLILAINSKFGPKTTRREMLA